MELNILIHALSHLDFWERVGARSVCTAWNRVLTATPRLLVADTLAIRSSLMDMVYVTIGPGILTEGPKGFGVSKLWRILAEAQRWTFPKLRCELMHTHAKRPKALRALISREGLRSIRLKWQVVGCQTPLIEYLEKPSASLEDLDVHTFSAEERTECKHERRSWVAVFTGVTRLRFTEGPECVVCEDLCMPALRDLCLIRTRAISFAHDLTLTRLYISGGKAFRNLIDYNAVSATRLELRLNAPVDLLGVIPLGRVKGVQTLVLTLVNMFTSPELRRTIMAMLQPMTGLTHLEIRALDMLPSDEFQQFLTDLKAGTLSTTFARADRPDKRSHQ